MNKGKFRENHAGDFGVISTTVIPERVGIPHRVSEDLCIAGEEVVRVHEGGILEVFYRGNIEWWTVRLAEDYALINSALLEPLSGSLGASLSAVEISDCEPPPFRGSGHKPISLVPFRPSGRFEPPPFLTRSLSAITLAQETYDSAEATSPVMEDAVQLLPPQVRALQDLIARNPGELSYKKGDIIDVELRSTADKWQGRLGSQIGIFHLDHSLEPIIKERVRAIWDYSSSAPGDLRFKSGDIIEVCGTSGTSNWWFHGWVAKRGFGMFPYNFVESIEDEFPDVEDEVNVFSQVSPVGKASTRFRALTDIPAADEGALSLKQGDIIDLIERQTDYKWLGRVKFQIGTFVLDNSVEPIMTDRVKAVFSYCSFNPEELSFVVNDCITVVGPSDESTLWWYGTLKGRVGLFPLNYVELIPDERDPADEADEWVEAKVPQTLRALHNFSSKDPAILSFDAGDIIKVVDAGSATDWWKGELDDRSGMFPRTYCEEILDQDDKKQEDFVFVGNHSSIFNDQLAGPSNSTQQRSPHTIYGYEFGDPEELAFKRGDMIGVPDLLAPDLEPMDKTVISSRHYDQGPNPPSPHGIALPSPRLSTIPELATPATRFSNEFISVSPGQLTPTNPLGSLSVTPRGLSSLPWTPCFARALYKYEGKASEELSFLKGDVVEVLAMTSTDWWIGMLRYETGRVPTKYLELIDLKNSQESSYKPEPHAATALPQESNHANLNPAGGKPVPVPGVPVQDFPMEAYHKRGIGKESLSQAGWVRARHRWNSHKAGELVLQAGDLIQVLKRPYEHWWKGRLDRNGQVGLFPANFIEAAPPPTIPERQESPEVDSSTFKSDEAVVALHLNIGKLRPLLQAFDMHRDITENAEIQDLFRTSCILRRKASRLLGEKPDDKDMKMLDLSFQEVKAHYEKILEMCAKRALEQDAERKPWTPTLPAGRGMSTTDDNTPTGKSKLKPVPNHPTPERRDTGGSTHRISLPPTPAPDSAALASMLSKRNSHGEGGGRKRYSGRLSAIEADIKRAKRAYQESIRSKENAKPRRLPPTDNPIRIFRTVRDMIKGGKGTNMQSAPDNKTIHLPKVEYIHNHIVYGNQ